MKWKSLKNSIKFYISKAPTNLHLELIDLQASRICKNNFNENNLIVFYSQDKFGKLENFCKINDM